jgi:hypothetical protein
MDTPVIVETQDLPVVHAQVLGRVRGEVARGRHLAVADRDEQVLVAIEGQPRAVVAHPL